MLTGFVDRTIAPWVQRFMARHGLKAPDPVQQFSWNAASGERILLHVGCGHLRKQHTVPGFFGDVWREVRLDADASVAPDVVASMTQMPQVPDGTVDAIFSSHNIEHLYPHEVPVALTEFFRVLKPDGFLVLTCPDLQSLCRLVVDDKLDEPAYISGAGPIAPLDVLYGLRSSMAAGNLYMAHRCGFTLRTLMEAVRVAGFKGRFGAQRAASFDLWLLAHKEALTAEDLSQRARDFLPLQE